jgi:hypothetical protein
MVMLTIILFVVVSSIIELLVIYHLSKNRQNKRKEYVERFGYKYIGSDKEFERSILKGIVKAHPILRWLSVRISDIFTNEDTEEKRFYFEIYVTNRYNSQRYFCMLVKGITLSLPISEFAIVPRGLSKFFISKKTPFLKYFIVKPKEIIDNIPYDLKEHLLRFTSVGIVYKDNEILILKAYKHKELPVDALRVCEDVYEWVKKSFPMSD